MRSQRKEGRKELRIVYRNPTMLKCAFAQTSAPNSNSDSTTPCTSSIGCSRPPTTSGPLPRLCEMVRNLEQHHPVLLEVVQQFITDKLGGRNAHEAPDGRLPFETLDP